MLPPSKTETMLKTAHEISNQVLVAFAGCFRILILMLHSRLSDTFTRALVTDAFVSASSTKLQDDDECKAVLSFPIRSACDHTTCEPRSDEQSDHKSHQAPPPRRQNSNGQRYISPDSANSEMKTHSSNTHHINSALGFTQLRDSSQTTQQELSKALVPMGSSQPTSHTLQSTKLNRVQQRKRQCMDGRVTTTTPAKNAVKRSRGDETTHVPVK